MGCIWVNTGIKTDELRNFLEINLPEVRPWSCGSQVCVTHLGGNLDLLPE